MEKLELDFQLLTLAQGVAVKKGLSRVRLLCFGETLDTITAAIGTHPVRAQTAALCFYSLDAGVRARDDRHPEVRAPGQAEPLTKTAYYHQ